MESIQLPWRLPNTERQAQSYWNQEENLLFSVPLVLVLSSLKAFLMPKLYSLLLESSYELI